MSGEQCREASRASKEADSSAAVAGIIGVRERSEIERYLDPELIESLATHFTDLVSVSGAGECRIWCDDWHSVMLL